MYGLTIYCTGPETDYYASTRLLRVELKGIRRANYLQLTKGARAELASKLAWTYSMFPAYSVDAQARGVEGKCRHTRAKYFSTSKV